jgi:peptide/nickel transport system substrate-binding protein
MNKRFRILTLCLVAVLLIVGLAACGTTEAPEEPAAPTEVSEATAAPEPTEAPDVEPTEVEPTEVPAEPEPTQPPPEPTEESAAVEEEPVLMRVGGVQDIDCWNPYTCAYIWDWGDIIYEGFHGKGSWQTGCEGVPRLAKSMEASEDGLTWTIQLNEGVTFSDGTPFNAQSAVDFIEWIRSTESLVYWFYETTYMTDVQAIDDYTFQFTTEYPISNFPNMDAVWMWMLPPHIWGEMDEAEALAFENAEPVGTGPYQLTEYAPGQYMIFDALENYYQGKPPVDRIVYQIYSNTDALINALISGEIDLTTKDLTPEYFDVLASAENVTVVEMPPGNDHFLAFNMYAGANKHPAIEDPAVREAIDHAIDREFLVDVILLGHGVVCPNNYACGPAWEAVLNPDLEVTPFDLEKANEILDDAGYVDTDGDGIRETPDGEPLAFRLAYAVEVPSEVAMTDSIKGWLAEIGIDVEVEAQETGTLTDNVLGQRDFDMAIIYTTTDIDPGYMDFSGACWAADAGTSGWNMPGYCNPEMDELVFAYMTTPDKEEAMGYMFEAQAIFNQDRPLLILAGENLVQAYRDDRFTFPHDPCGEGNGLWSYPSILNVEVKQ